MSIQSVADHRRFEFDLADRMRKTLRVSGASVHEMADYLAVTPRTVSNWINGRIAPTRPTLILWALATGFPFKWLETGEEPAPDWTPPTEPPEGIEPSTYSLVVETFRGRIHTLAGAAA